MDAHSFWSQVKQAYTDWSDDKASRLAAALAYYAVFSLAALVVLAVVVLSYFMSGQTAQETVVTEAQQFAGETGAAAARQMIENQPSRGAGIFATLLSVAILLWSGSYVFAELQDSMNTIWEVKQKPNLGWRDWFRRRLLAMLLVFVVGALLIASLVASTVVTSLSAQIFGNAPVLGPVIDFVVSTAVVTLLFAVIFKYLPDVRIDWSDVLLGAFVTAVLFSVGRIGLALYLSYGSTASAFGAAGSLAALLVWVYYSAQIFFFGAEFTQVYARRHGRAIEPDEHAIALSEEERTRMGMDPRHSENAQPARPPQATPAPALPSGRRPVRLSKDHLVLATPRHDEVDKERYKGMGAGLALGLAVGAVGAVTRMRSKGKITSREARALQMRERLDRIERRLDKYAHYSGQLHPEAEPHREKKATPERPTVTTAARDAARSWWDEFRGGWKEGKVEADADLHPGLMGRLRRLGRRMTSK